MPPSNDSLFRSSAPDGSVLVIVPTYNEAENVVQLIEQVLALPGHYDLLVVDDNSPDGTADRVLEVQRQQEGRVHLSVRPGKQGLGTAYVHGFRWALERNYSYICEMDADLSHNPSDLPRLVEMAASGADLAIGSRYADGVRVLNWPLIRLILSYGAGVYTRAITRMPVRDVTSGFKCFRRQVLETIDLERIRSNGYAFQVEMTYRTYVAGFAIVEIPITFTERTEGQSKMSKAIVREAAWKVWELRLRKLFGKL